MLLTPQLRALRSWEWAKVSGRCLGKPLYSVGGSMRNLNIPNALIRG